MKKLRTLLIVALAIMCSLSLFAACGEPKPNDETKYTVTYVAGATDATGTAPAAESYAEGEKVTLKGAGVFIRPNYTFDKWSDGTNTYDAGATFTMPAKNVEFTATWKAVSENPPDEEVLPEGTQTVTAIATSTLQTVNGNATANWFAKYDTAAFKLTAEVADTTYQADANSIYKSDSIEVYVDKTRNAKGYSEDTLHILADVKGRVEVRKAESEEKVTGSTITATACPLTIDGKTVAGYRIELTIPYGEAGLSSADKNVALALGFYDQVDKSTANSAYDETYGTDRTRVNTFMAVTDDDTFAENPYIAANFWGAPNGVVTSDIWDLEHESDAENAYIEMTENNYQDNYIYMLNSNKQPMYAEVKVSVTQFMTDAGGNYDKYPKFGMVVTTPEGSGYFFFIDAVADQQSGVINANSVQVGHNTKTGAAPGNWGPNWAMDGLTAGDSSDAYQNGNYITLGVYRQDKIIVFYINGKALPRLELSSLTEKGAYVGLASFNLKLRAKDYKVVTDPDELSEYYIDLDEEKMQPIKTIDGNMNDWTESEKTNPFVIPASEGQSVTIYASKDDHGVNLFYDVYHKQHKTTEADWFMNTNAEFYIGNSGQFYINSKGEKSLGTKGVGVMTTTDPSEAGGLYHTVAEVFLPYADIPGYNKDAASIPARFCWKVGGAFGNVWEAGDWWRTDGDNSSRGSLITENGFLKATKRTIDGSDADWSNADWVTSGRSTWAATLEEDGLYVIIKLEQTNISNNRAFFSGADADGSKWYLNQNIELFGTDNMQAARIAYLNGKAYHTTFVNEAAAQYTAKGDGDTDKLTFEFFVATANLKGVDSDTESIKVRVGGQLYGDDTDEAQHYQEYIHDTDVITPGWVDKYTVAFELGYEGGEAPASVYVKKNGTVQTLPTAARGGYKFLGWFVKNPDGTVGDTELTTSFTIVEDITVSAKWEKVIDGSLENWTQKQQETCIELTGDNDRYVKMYAFTDDFGINIYYDVMHRLHLTDNPNEWWKNTNVEFFFGDPAEAKQYYVSANGSTSGNIDLYYFHTDTLTEGEKYHTIFEGFISYANIDDFTKDSPFINGFFAWKVDDLAGRFEDGFTQDLGDPGSYVRDTSSEQEAYRRSTIVTRDGILGAQEATSKTIDGDLQDWEEGDFHDTPAEKLATGVTARWAAKRYDDGLYAALEVKADEINMVDTYRAGDWWQNTNFELWGGGEAAHYSGRIMLYHGETVHTSSIDQAKIVFIDGQDGAQDTLILEFFVCALRSRVGAGTRIDIGGQLWGGGRTNGGNPNQSFQDYARYIVF